MSNSSYFTTSSTTPSHPSLSCQTNQSSILTTPSTKSYSTSATTPFSHAFSVPAEIPGDVFDRQRIMRDFDQTIIENQSALVLGVGGLGSSAAMALTRLGVKNLFLLDRDRVEESNLNRQILFNSHQLGQYKASAAQHSLLTHHNLCTHIENYPIDAVVQWSTVVELARRSTVIFNNIDHGAVFDYAVNSLCQALKIPYISGSSYANSIQVDFYSQLKNQSCWSCANYCNDSFNHSENQLKLSKFLQQKVKQVHGDTAAAVYDNLQWKEKLPSIRLSSDDIISLLAETRFIFSPISTSIISFILTDLNLTTLTISQFTTEFVPRFQRLILAELCPSGILRHKDLNFIPTDSHVMTRSVGSWIAVCCSGGMLQVNSWVQFLMKNKHTQNTANGSANNSNSSDDSSSANINPAAVSVGNWSEFNFSLSEGGLYSTAGFVTEQDPKCSICHSTSAI